MTGATSDRAIPSTPVPIRLRYTAVEACISMVFGFEPWAAPLPPAVDASPRAALEGIVKEALARPPCLVTFSGGRDSSAVLALAAHVARREGLPEPIAITNRFPDVAETDEDEWQETVIRTVGIKDWVRLEWADELDVLGPPALRVMERHGLAYPFNLHFIDPMASRAAGGSLLTGMGGDEIFGPWLRPTLRALLYRRQRPSRSTLRPLAAELLPRRARVNRAAAAQLAYERPWLREDVRRHIAEVRAATQIGTSPAWTSELDRYWRTRYAQCGLASLRALGGDYDVQVLSPFAEARHLAAWAAEAGAAGPPGRTRALRELVGDLLPIEVIERRTKASFDGAFFGPATRQFIAEWSGEGLDDRLIDPERLQAEWSSNEPSLLTATLVRLAWLAETTRRPSEDRFTSR